jgi:hypothetical protein
VIDLIHFKHNWFCHVMDMETDCGWRGGGTSMNEQVSCEKKGRFDSMTNILT